MDVVRGDAKGEGWLAVGMGGGEGMDEGDAGDSLAAVGGCAEELDDEGSVWGAFPGSPVDDEDGGCEDGADVVGGFLQGGAGDAGG